MLRACLIKRIHVAQICCQMYYMKGSCVKQVHLSSWTSIACAIFEAVLGTNVYISMYKAQVRLVYTYISNNS